MKREIIWRPEGCQHFCIARVVPEGGSIRYELIPRTQQVGVRYPTKREAINAADAGCRLRHCSRVKPKLVWTLTRRGQYVCGDWSIDQRMHRVGGRNPERMWDLSKNGEHLHYYETVQEARDAAEMANQGKEIRLSPVGGVKRRSYFENLWDSGPRNRRAFQFSGVDGSWNTSGGV